MTIESKETPSIDKPNVVIIENYPKNGSNPFLITTEWEKLDSQIKSYLKGEAKQLGLELREIEQEIAEASQKTSHGKKVAKRTVSNIRESKNKQLVRIKQYQKVLTGERYAALKIKIEGKDVSSWEFAREADAGWAAYVREERPDILQLSQDDIAIVQEAFTLRYKMSFGEEEAKESYFRLVKEELSNRTDLDSYISEITSKLSRR